MNTEVHMTIEKSFTNYDSAIWFIDQQLDIFSDEYPEGEFNVTLRFVNHQWQVLVSVKEVP